MKSFRTTNVLRWEYKPGSTLFVVWQQARENDAVPGGFRFGRDVHDIFGVAPKNVFLVKLAYWSITSASTKTVLAEPSSRTSSST